MVRPPGAGSAAAGSSPPGTDRSRPTLAVWPGVRRTRDTVAGMLPQPRQSAPQPHVRISYDNKEASPKRPLLRIRSWAVPDGRAGNTKIQVDIRPPSGRLMGVPPRTGGSGADTDPRGPQGGRHESTSGDARTDLPRFALLRPVRRTTDSRRNALRPVSGLSDNPAPAGPARITAQTAAAGAGATVELTRISGRDLKRFSRP